jgi:hypothetical protein
MSKQTKGILNREQLLQKRVLKIEKVSLEDGNFIYVRQMTGTERDTFEHSIMEVKRENNNIRIEQKTEYFRSKLAVVTICDEKGELLLKPDDYKTLSDSISAKDLESIVNAAQKLNKISPEDKEEIVKNLGAGLTGNSTSVSVGN